MSDFTVALIGDKNVGKTAVLRALAGSEPCTSNLFHVEPAPSANPLANSAETVRFPASRCSLGIDRDLLVVDCPAPHSYDLSDTLNSCFTSVIGQASCVCVVCDAGDPKGQIALLRAFWLPAVRKFGGERCPVVLVFNKADTVMNLDEVSAAVTEFVADYPEIEGYLACSAAENEDVRDLLDLCVKAIVFPMGPLFDTAQNMLKRKAVEALSRVFSLLDRDRDGALNGEELNRFHELTQPKNSEVVKLTPEVIVSLKRKIAKGHEDNLDDEGNITLQGFIYLNTIFITKMQQDCVWRVLYTFGYEMSLELSELYANPTIPVLPPGRRYEMSSTSAVFLADLFAACDHDKDGYLSPKEAKLFFLTCEKTPFALPEDEHIPLRSLIQNFRMICLLDPAQFTQTMFYLGFEGRVADAIVPVRVVLPKNHPDFRAASEMDRKENASASKTVEQRKVFLGYVFGSRGSGKTTLLKALTREPVATEYVPTSHNEIRCGNFVDDEKQLVLCEFVNEENALRNQENMPTPDVVCLVHDVTSATSFEHVYKAHNFIIEHTPWIPCVHFATKTDRPAVKQLCEKSPQAFLKPLCLPLPYNLTFTGISDNRSLFFAKIFEACVTPNRYVPSKRFPFSLPSTIASILESASARAKRNKLENAKRDEEDAQNFKNMRIIARKALPIVVACMTVYKMVSLIKRRWNMSRGRTPPFDTTGIYGRICGAVWRVVAGGDM